MSGCQTSIVLNCQSIPPPPPPPVSTSGLMIPFWEQIDGIIINDLKRPTIKDYTGKSGYIPRLVFTPGDRART